MDIVFIKQLQVDTVIGVYDWEKPSSSVCCWILRWLQINGQPQTAMISVLPWTMPLLLRKLPH
ncbi:hypothetical protein ALON55S_07376 [Alishewanella longhuensis]